jgi:hypothetical protein
MKFIVERPTDEQRIPSLTHCVLCSEDPRRCPPTS